MSGYGSGWLSGDDTGSVAQDTFSRQTANLPSVPDDDFFAAPHEDASSGDFVQVSHSWAPSAYDSEAHAAAPIDSAAPRGSLHSEAGLRAAFDDSNEYQQRPPEQSSDAFWLGEQGPSAQERLQRAAAAFGSEHQIALYGSPRHEARTASSSSPHAPSFGDALQMHTGDTQSSEQPSDATSPTHQPGPYPEQHSDDTGARAPADPFLQIRPQPDEPALSHEASLEEPPSPMDPALCSPSAGPPPPVASAAPAHVDTAERRFVSLSGPRSDVKCDISLADDDSLLMLQPSAAESSSRRQSSSTAMASVAQSTAHASSSMRVSAPPDAASALPIAHEHGAQHLDAQPRWHQGERQGPPHEAAVLRDEGAADVATSTHARALSSALQRIADGTPLAQPAQLLRGHDSGLSGSRSPGAAALPSSNSPGAASPVRGGGRSGRAARGDQSPPAVGRRTNAKRATPKWTSMFGRVLGRSPEPPPEEEPEVPAMPESEVDAAIAMAQAVLEGQHEDGNGDATGALRTLATLVTQLAREKGAAIARGDDAHVRAKEALEAATDAEAQIGAIRDAYAAVRAERERGQEKMDDLERRYLQALQDVVLLRQRADASACGICKDWENAQCLASTDGEDLAIAPYRAHAVALRRMLQRCEACLEHERARAVSLAERLRELSMGQLRLADVTAAHSDLQRELARQADVISELRTALTHEQETTTGLRAQLTSLAEPSQGLLSDYRALDAECQHLRAEVSQLKQALDRTNDTRSVSSPVASSRSPTQRAGTNGSGSTVAALAGAGPAGEQVYALEEQVREQSEHISRLEDAVRDALEMRDCAEAALADAMAAARHAEARHGHANNGASDAPRQSVATGPAGDQERWRSSAEAEAEARRLLQTILREYYGVAADHEWFAAQGVDVSVLLDSRADAALAQAAAAPDAAGDTVAAASNHKHHVNAGPSVATHDEPAVAPPGSGDHAAPVMGAAAAEERDDAFREAPEAAREQNSRGGLFGYFRFR